MDPQNGKGSKRRPMGIDSDAYSKNWERIFNETKDEYPDNPLEGGVLQNRLKYPQPPAEKKN